MVHVENINNNELHDDDDDDDDHNELHDEFENLHTCHFVQTLTHTE